MAIEVTEERTGDVLVLLPSERLDSSSARAFESILMGHVSNGQRRIVVDFSRLHFIASSGLRVLLLAARALKVESGMLALCAMETNVENVFRVSGLHRIIAVETSRDAAIELVAQPLAGQSRRL